MENQTQKATTAYRVTLSKNAVKNIDEITGYIAFINQQPLNAVRAGDAIFNILDRIQKNPKAYKECNLIPTKSKMYRQTKCLSWYIIYKIKFNQVTILGIIHSSENHLNEGH